MSTNDDSTSRRDRRPDQGNQRYSQSRADGWSQRDRDPGAGRYYDERGRGDHPPQQQRSSFSGFSRHSYPPPQEPPAPPPQRFEPTPAYSPSSYSDNPPLPPLEQEHPPILYGQSERDDLFARDPNGYDNNRAPAPDRFAPPSSNRPGPLSDSSTFTPPPPPSDDYAYSSRSPAQEATRFYLPDEEPQAPRAAPAPQHYAERAYAPQPYETTPAPRSLAPGHYGHDAYGAHHSPGQDWGEQHPIQPHGHGDDLEDDFFADEDDLDHEIDTPKKRKRGLILVALLAAAGLGGGGAYAYKYVLKSGGAATDGGPLLVSADRNPPKDAPKDPGGRQFGNGEKTIYSRLMPDGQQVEVPLGGGKPNTEPARPVTAGNSLEDRLEAWKRAQANAASGNPPQRPDQPTVVAPEIYGPDGRKVEPQRQVVTPNFASANQGQLPPPFGNNGGGAQAQASVPSAFRPSVAAGGVQGFNAAAAAKPAAPFNTASQAALPQAQPQKVAANAPKAGASTAAAVAGGGFYVQIKSGQDEKLATRELQTLSEKFGSVIGNAQMTTKTVDLGEKKGVWIRTVVGPVATKEEATELCTKLKGAGLPSCFVTKSD